MFTQRSKENGLRRVLRIGPRGEKTIEVQAHRRIERKRRRAL